MRKLVVFVSLFLLIAPIAGVTKDKAVANEYPVILVVNDSGKVAEVITQDEMPKKIKQKTLDAFIGKKIGIKRKFGRAVSYKQKITVSTKHLIDNSQISQR